MVMFQFCIIALLVGVSVGTVSSAVVLKIGAITIGIKKYKSIIKKKKTWPYSVVSKIEVLISKALIDLLINHDEFVSVNNVLNVNKVLNRYCK